MSWRGQSGKRAKGRRGDQDPELDNTAWLAELEREAAAQADDDDEDDWASTLRGRRPPVPPTPTPAPPPPDPGWPPSDPRYQGAEPGYGPDPDGYWPGAGSAGPDQGGAGSDPWAAEPGPQGADPAPDPDWSWRPPAADAFGEPPQTGPDPGWERYGEGTGLDPVPDAFGDQGRHAGAEAGWGSQSDAQSWDDPGSGAGDPGDGSDPGGRGGADGSGWRSAGAESPTGAWDAVEPVGREPDYPALFGELYRRSAAQQDPIWEAPPAVDPMPEQGQPDPPSAAWPFEETTQSWEPSDRSFIWPSDELPSTQAEWDQPGSTSWLEDPQPAAPPEPDQTAAWPAPGSRAAWEDPAPEPATEPRPSPWASQPGAGNGVAPPGPQPAGPQPAGPPPDDWAAAIPTDVPAARRAADPSSTQVWRPDEAEPGVPLGPGAGAPGGTTRRRRRPPAGEATDFGGGAGPRTARGAAEAAGEPGGAGRTAAIDTGKGRRNRPAGERQARAWPRVVAVISWIVLLMVLCWYYVFPWLERVLPENF
jgi:hypothetical protein